MKQFKAKTERIDEAVEELTDLQLKIENGKSHPLSFLQHVDTYVAKLLATTIQDDPTYNGYS